jgi:transcription-repair coupling factor (superfamily II helicase)
VPVASLQLISRYAGSDPEHAPLHRLGSEQWEKAQRKAREKARDVAAQLLEVYARREARTGLQFTNPAGRLRSASPRPSPSRRRRTRPRPSPPWSSDMFGPGVMDRLVCGDVGFGKTEVAMRAAFIATANAPPGRCARAHHAAGPAALQLLPRPLRRLARAHRGAVALPLQRRSHGTCSCA